MTRPLRPALFVPLLVAVVFGVGLGCGSPQTSAPTDEPSDPPWFQDVTGDVGLDFVHDAGPVPTNLYFMPQIMGSGCALFDYDNDGRLDIYLIQNGGPTSSSRNRLYHQEANGKFRDVSAGSGLDIAGYGQGVAVGDVNNDGRPDVLVTEYGNARLFLNQGGGKFLDITREAGIDNPQWGTSACFFDYDRDGWLDLALTNYVDYDPTKPCGYGAGKPDYCHPSAFAGTVTRLYHNLGGAGKPGRFEDVTVRSGLGSAIGPGLGVVCADFTGDGWPDIFVANDARPNHLWVSHGPPEFTFTEEAVKRGLAYNMLGQVQANMGIALGDVDGNGMLDLFVTHLTEETHTLWKQGPRGAFCDRTGVSGLATTRWRGTGFGTVLADFDHDGWPDLAVVNGRVSRGASAVPKPGASFWSSYEERNQLFAGKGGGSFRDISPQERAFCGGGAIGRGLAWGDIDSDGDVDLLVSNAAGPARVYFNVAPKAGHWLAVRAVDPALGGRDACGAEVTVRAGARRWLGLVSPGQSYESSSDPRVHFGLGAAERVDEIRVVWPDGTAETFPGQEADRVVEIRKGTGRREEAGK